MVRWTTRGGIRYKMNRKGQESFVRGLIALLITIGFCYGLFWYLPHFAMGWDTGVMTGTIIGYDSNLFGTKTVFVLEDKTIFSQEKGMSQSEIRLCSDYDDTEIHRLIEEYLNKKVIIEYKERRVGYYPYKYCHDAPITSIKLVESKQ
jgi:hypothetical protein